MKKESNLEQLERLLQKHDKHYHKIMYDNYVTIDVHNKTYDFKINGELIGTYNRHKGVKNDEIR